MNEMNVTNVQYFADFDGNNTCVRATIDGTEMSVPLDTANRHYTAILEWVAEGNTITPAS